MRVTVAAGVRDDHAPCAGLGVTLTKSAKLNGMPGVVGAHPRKPLVPGVMCDEGSGVDFDGGVEGATMGVLIAPAEGELARNISRSAPSPPSFFGVRDQDTLAAFRMRRSGGGVRGGDEASLVEELTLKLWRGRSASSSSLD